jgi:hypothetical protein
VYHALRASFFLFYAIYDLFGLPAACIYSGT